MTKITEVQKQEVESSNSLPFTPPDSKSWDKLTKERIKLKKKDKDEEV